VDKLSPQKRSEIMGRIHGKNTTPERRVRKTLHSMGYRFRLHRKELPGKPDIVLPRFRLCIFVNGCFWHQHIGCRRAGLPSSNIDFWEKKLHRTVERDKENIIALTNLGWHTLTVWECETKDFKVLQHILKKTLARLNKNGQ
jgi:DNA mismatch endonuclease, patch repair protein